MVSRKVTKKLMPGQFYFNSETDELVAITDDNEAVVSKVKFDPVRLKRHGKDFLVRELCDRINKRLRKENPDA